MDPNANVKEQLELANGLLRLQDRVASNHKNEAYQLIVENEAMRLAELVVSLDDWLRLQGFLPERWQGIKKAPKTMTHQELLNKYTAARLYVICEVSADFLKDCSLLCAEVRAYAEVNGLEEPDVDWETYILPADL